MKKRSVSVAKSNVSPDVSDRSAAQDGSDSDSVTSLKDNIKTVDETYLDQGYDAFDTWQEAI